MDLVRRLFTSTPSPSPPKDASKPARRNRNQLYSQPLPLKTYPLPPLYPTQPLSYLQLLYALLLPYIRAQTSHTHIHTGYYSPLTRSVHVTDKASIRALWEQGFFGKGSLSRSEPEWLEREKKRLGLSEGDRVAADVTNRRRQERRAVKRERARLEREELEAQLKREGQLTNAMDGPDNSPNDRNETEKTPAPPDPPTTPPSQTPQPSAPPTHTPAHPQPTPTQQEHLQLTPHESLYLSHLGVLTITPTPTSPPLSPSDLLTLFRRTSTFPPYTSATIPPDDPFLTSYAVYAHFRSLGWVVRPGVKFAADWLLYARGPVFAHAEFAVVVMPSYSRWEVVGDGSDADEGSKADEGREADARRTLHYDPVSSQGRQRKEHGSWREKGEFWQVHAISRVQTQVMKSLVLCYVDVPTAGKCAGLEGDLRGLLRLYRIREFVVRRWTPNRNR